MITMNSDLKQYVFFKFWSSKSKISSWRQKQKFSKVMFFLPVMGGDSTGLKFQYLKGRGRQISVFKARLKVSSRTTRTVLRILLKKQKQKTE